jgi:hypothetical protein
MSEAKSTKGLRKEEVEKAPMDGSVCDRYRMYLSKMMRLLRIRRVLLSNYQMTKTSIAEICHSANKEMFLTRSIVVRNQIVDLGLYSKAEALTTKMEDCQRLMKKNKQLIRLQS